MNTHISKTLAISSKSNTLLLCDKKGNFEKFGFSKEELAYISKCTEKDKKLIAINRFDHWIFVQFIDSKHEIYQTNEACRKAGNDLVRFLNEQKIEDLTILDINNHTEASLALAEGIALGNYQFLKYKNNKKKESNSLKSIFLKSDKLKDKEAEMLNIVIEATFIARNLVNEPLSYLTAVQLSKEIEGLGKEAGFKVEVMNKAKIEALKMGGLLAVNKGSIDPPTFTVMEWKPKNSSNKNPYILVGKGVVFDTGGLSLKPTLNSMDSMKSDMAGAAAVACSIYAIAKAKLPVHVIGLIPATDNRPDGNAYVPGDVITLHNGKTVEVLNTDAEGRLLLGDALSYAQKYKPELVIDLATLTGSAVAAIGMLGIVAMGNAPEKVKAKLKQSGNNVYERLAEMPFWEEYGDLIKSDIADIKNVGGPYAGAITAGKFLEHFTNYPWIHLDIAGPSFFLIQTAIGAKEAQEWE